MHALRLTGRKLLAAATVSFLLAGAGCDSDSSSAIQPLPVRRGNLEILLQLEGTLRPVKEVNIKSSRWGEIKSLAPNGSRVKAGQVVMELDSENLEDSLYRHEIEVEVRSAELRQVKTEVEKARKRAELHLATSRLNLELEESLYRELKARPTERELTDAMTRLELARSLVQAGKESVVLVRELVDSGFAAAEELRAAALDLARSEANLAAAVASLATVKAGSSEVELKQASIKVQQAKLAEQSARNNIEITREWTEAKLARFQRRLQREKEELEEARGSMFGYRAVAPNDGVVLYARHRHGDTWQPGKHVWQGVTVMSIPDLSHMKVIVQIPAMDVRRLDQPGKLPARIHVAASPDRIYTGRLTKISNVGRDEFEQLDPSTAEKLGRAERQVFEAEIRIKEETSDLKPGFSARAELIIKNFENVLIIPKMALSASVPAGRKSSRGSERGRGSKPGSSPRRGRRSPNAGNDEPMVATVYVQTAPDRYEARTVKILGSNRFEAAVEGPLRAGQLLYPGRPRNFLVAAANTAKKESR